MYFTKPVNQITFEDVVAFLHKEVAENTMLDYKLMLPKDNEKFAKTIAAFANSMGGTVVIGVKDEHDKPKPPFTGIPFHTKIRGQIESIIQNYIDPLVFVDIATCKDPQSNNMFVVVNIPQSNLTPHLVGKLKRAYVRTGQSSRPEIIVHPEQLPWLLDNRRKSQNLRHILTDKAEAHFNNYLRSKRKDPQSAQAVMSFSLIPMYPQAHITDYKKLPQMAGKIQVKCNGHIFPNMVQARTVQDGIIIPLDAVSSLELNAYGLMLYKSVLADGETHFLNTVKFYKEAVLFFKTAALFYNELGFISPLSMRLKLANARGCKVKTQTGEKQILEDFIRIDKIITPMDLQGGLIPFLTGVIDEFAWALDLPFEDTGAAEKFIREVVSKCNN